jgi:hypothetical protein
MNYYSIVPPTINRLRWGKTEGIARRPVHRKSTAAWLGMTFCLPFRHRKGNLPPISQPDPFFLGPIPMAQSLSSSLEIGYLFLVLYLERSCKAYCPPTWLNEMSTIMFSSRQFIILTCTWYTKHERITQVYEKIKVENP